MLYLTCTTITRVDLAHYGVSRAKDWVSVDCGTIAFVTKTLNAQDMTKHVTAGQVRTGQDIIRKRKG